MIRRILKWTGITLLTIILLVVVAVASRQNLKFEAPYPAIKSSTDSAVIARGKEVVLGVGHCVECHGPKNYDSLLKAGQEVALSGGNEFKLPFGTLYTHNITSDKETGIGLLTDEQVGRIIRHGVHPDGKAVFMPSYDFTDEDLTAIISYLRTQKPVHKKVPDHDVNLLGDVVKAFLFKPVNPYRDIPAPVTRDSTVEYGKYLAISAAKCAECHTQDSAKLFGGGEPMGFEGEPAIAPPNLTQDPTGRIYGWSQEDFIKRFRMGKVIPHSHMPWNTFKRASDNDLKAIYKFLQTVKPVKTEPEKK
jgi:mono/diheme cytochrome c family protein